MAVALPVGVLATTLALGGCTDEKKSTDQPNREANPATRITDDKTVEPVAKGVCSLVTLDELHEATGLTFNRGVDGLHGTGEDHCSFVTPGGKDGDPNQPASPSTSKILARLGIGRP